MTDSEKLSEVHAMAMTCMNTTYMYKYVAYRPSENWTFDFNDVDFANGQCQYSRMVNDIRNIFLSRWIILRTEYNIDFWRRIMLHEIAHAIDIEIRNDSLHDATWFDIAESIGGCSNTRNEAKWLKPFTKDKYLRTCPSCGLTAPISVSPISASSCGICHPKGFSKAHKFIIKDNPNYITE